MARKSGSQNELVKCEYCGELYSVTYKHCPFCNEDGTGRWDDPGDEYDDEYDDEAPRARGGKRLAGGSSGRGNSGGRGYGGPSIGRIIGTVLSLALIVAAVCIVISIVKSTLDKDPAPENSNPPAASASVQPSESQAPGESQPTESLLPESQPPASAPAETVQATPAAGKPTGFKLNRDDFTFESAGQVFQMKATYSPAGTSGDITWKSSDPNIASVSWNGVVTAVAQGTVTLTATVEGAGEQTCIVRCNFKAQSGGAAASQAPAAANTSSPSASGLSLNREDFTLGHAGETFRLVVKGSGSAVTWASSNTGVATVASDGTVTAVSKGTANVTATVDGVTLKCIVRCSF